ncbi:MAG: carboxypeptidase-like regulatory domain-containing protein [Candidatus Acidiferrales bacterium]
MNARTARFNGSRRRRTDTEIDYLQVVAVLLALLVLLFGWATRARAQVAEASIWGTVTDATGAAVPGAKVTVTDVETGAARSLVTDASGKYDAPALLVGNYDVSIQKQGFRPEEEAGITLVVGQRREVTVALTVGAVQQVIKVEDTNPPVSVSTVEPSGLVGEQQVKDLPLNGRSYDQLITLNPGIVNYSAERSGTVGTSNSVVGNMFAVSGRRPQENLFLLNGVEYTGASEIDNTPGGASGQLLGVDAVREFAVVTDTYGAEYGKRPGAQVNIVTESGANELHGSVYEFLRNSDLDARNFFDQGAIPPFERNVFGAALGGPIKKDKTFFFVNYEGFRQHLGVSDVTFVPDAEAREGFVPSSCPGTSTTTLTNVGVAASVAPLLALWPVANGPDLGCGVAEDFSHPLQAIREDFGTARIDHTFSTRDTTDAVYTIDDSADNTPTADPLSYDVESLREQVASVSETHLFSPTVLNKATFGFSRAAFYFNGNSLVDVPGFVQNDAVGVVSIGGSTAPNSPSSITLAGTNAGDNLHAVRNLFTEEDQVTITRGNQLIELGVWLERLQANDELAQDQNAQATFTSLTTFLQGTVSSFVVAPLPTPLGWRSLEAAYYAQDVIKVRPNLEVRLAFRAESTNGWNEQDGRASNYEFTNGVINSTPTVGNSLLEANRAKFLPEPRVGISWAPFASRKTVIEAGFGMYDALLDNLSYRADQNGPFNTVFTIKNKSLSSDTPVIPAAPLPAGALISPSGVQPGLYTPEVESYSLKIEQQLSQTTSLSVGYVGSHGYHELLSIDANVPVPVYCPDSAVTACSTLPAGTEYIATGSPLANPNVSNTTSWFSEGDSSYNALQVDLRRNFSHGLQFRGVYTYSKSEDDGDTVNTSISTSSPAFTANPLDPSADWSRSTFDATHSAVANATWAVPFKNAAGASDGAHAFIDRLAENWALSGILTVQSGFPFTPQLGYNPTNDGDSRNPVRPNVNPSFSGPVILGGPNEYFNPAAFSAPVTGTYGDAGRDSLTGPGLTSLDFSVARKFPIKERLALQFRAEFFNILNHANFNEPNPVIFTSATALSPTAGVISSTTTTSRQIQFGLKLLW